VLLFPVLSTSDTRASMLSLFWCTKNRLTPRTTLGKDCVIQYLLQFSLLDPFFPSVSTTQPQGSSTVQISVSSKSHRVRLVFRAFWKRSFSFWEALSSQANARGVIGLGARVFPIYRPSQLPCLCGLSWCIILSQCRCLVATLRHTSTSQL